MDNIYKAPESEVTTEFDYIPVPVEILKPIRNAWITCLILVVLGAILSTYYVFYADSSHELFGVDNYFDYGLIVLLAIGIYRKSRIAAVLMLLYYIVSSIIVMVTLGKVAGLLFKIIVVYFLIKGVIATFKYHRHFKQQDKFYKASKSWLPWLLTPFIALVGVIIVYGTLMVFGQVVPTHVMPGSKVPDEYRVVLEANEIIKKDEKIIYFYSEGISSILEGGNLLMEDRVIGYETLEEELSVYSGKYSELEYIEIETKGDFLNDSLMYLELKDGTGFYILGSTENDGDVTMYNYIQRQIDITPKMVMINAEDIEGESTVGQLLEEIEAVKDKTDK